MKHCPIQDAVEKLEWSENMRVKKSSGYLNASFADCLLKVGDQKLETGLPRVCFTDHLMLNSDSLDDLYMPDVSGLPL